MNRILPSLGKTQLPTPPVKSSFPAIKPLPGAKKNFPEVTARVNSQPMIFWKLGNSFGVEVGMNRKFPSVGKTQLPKPQTLHDSSAVSACLKTADEDEDEDKFIQRKPTEVLTNPKGQYSPALLLRKSEKLRTPYSVPSNPVVDEAIKRKPTQPMKVLTGAVRQDRRVEFVPRRVVTAIRKWKIKRTRKRSCF
jgi:hypothetical protein